MDDFENFEFIDYTTSGPWERFITQIEDSLRAWGLVHGSLGVLDPATLSKGHTTDATAGSNQRDKSDNNTYNNDISPKDGMGCSQDNSPPGSERSHQLKDMLSLDDATFAFSYHYHPAMAKLAEGVDGIDLEFLPTTLDGVRYHSLHRWTSLTHFLVISPVTISDIFASSVTPASSAIIDLSSAKLMLSSFAIAFQNTGCRIPVFVPTGQPWNLTFTGLGIVPELQEENFPSNSDMYQSTAADDIQGIELRFNTFLIPYPPVQQTYLPGILDIFIQRMGIEDPESSVVPGTIGDKVKDKIEVSALFSYDLVNWYDEDWRRWKGLSETTKDRRDVSSSADALPLFSSDETPLNMDGITSSLSGQQTETTPSTMLLPFGPAQDPLESLRLFARFASAPSSLYLDNKDYADMDACNANIWMIRANFKSDDLGLLSGLLEEAIGSWNSETSRGNNQGQGGLGNSGASSEREPAYGTLLERGSRRLQDAITMVDTVDVDNIIDALFEMSLSDNVSATATSDSSSKGSQGLMTPIAAKDKKDRLLTASELGLQFRHATTVPYNSFLWKMVQHLLDVISPNSEISYATTVMGFLKVLWSELLKKFYQHWEESQLIPLIDIFGSSHGHTPLASDDVLGDPERKPVAIDLRYNILHQKLSMLNCCIARQMARNKDVPTNIHPVKRRYTDKAKLPESSPSATEVTTDNISGSTSPVPETQTYGSQLHNLLYGLSDISRPRSADVVPMAKRFLENVKNRRGVGFYGYMDDSLTSTGETSKIEPSSSAQDQISEVLFEQSDEHDSLRLHRKSSVASHSASDGDDGGEDVFYDPLEFSEAPNRLTRPTYLQRQAPSLTESYVALKYSSSVDSQSGVLVDDIDQSSVLAHGPDPREVDDDTKSEGGLKPLKNLRLLETGAPLMIPRLQEPGYMTEDMIQQQEELFETLGSSSDGAKMRAKMQSTQLISDMEAFKAANPGCVLGDFIRWHSPKDWLEDKGQMSARMADSGNYWQELWANSKRIPVSRQTPLFNHNQEAAKALFYLEGLSGEQLFLHFLPTMCLIAYDALVSHPVATHIRQVAQGLKDIGRELVQFPWRELASKDDMQLEQVLERFRQVELLMGRAIALIRKFPEQYDLVERILQRHETVVEDGPERQSVYELFCIGGSPLSSFPQPTSKEFILRTKGHSEDDFISEDDDAAWSTRPMPCRMYACFKESEARIVETVAKDGLFL
ncbi:Rab3 GTPase-activating protein catalytic subunit [Podila epigama]|nr:Rab3 GTPase-activating protein catalytic subunit [Podila epigama]